jgi:hypothetical protein
LLRLTPLIYMNVSTNFTNTLVISDIRDYISE